MEKQYHYLKVLLTVVYVKNVIRKRMDKIMDKYVKLRIVLYSLLIIIIFLIMINNHLKSIDSHNNNIKIVKEIK